MLKAVELPCLYMYFAYKKGENKHCGGVVFEVIICC